MEIAEGGHISPVLLTFGDKIAHLATLVASVKLLLHMGLRLKIGVLIDATADNRF